MDSCLLNINRIISDNVYKLLGEISNLRRFLSGVLTTLDVLSCILLFSLKTVADAGSSSNNLFSARLENARQFNSTTSLSGTHSLRSFVKQFIELSDFSLLKSTSHLLTFAGTKPLFIPDEVLGGWEMVFVIT